MNLQEAKNLIRQHPGQFYTYLLKRPNGTPFYVGKGNCKGFRIGDHVKEALSGKSKNSHKRNVIRKILESGKQIDYEIAEFASDEDRAFDLEMELIAFYGRKSQGGILCNMTDGGEGNCGGDGIRGQHHSEEAKRKMSEAHKGKTPWNKGTGKIKIKKERIPWNKGTKGIMISWNKGQRGLQKAWNKGIPCSNEKKIKISNSLKGKFHYNKGRIHSDEIRLKMADAHRGKKLSEQTKIKMSESGKRRWNRIKEAA